MGRQSQRLIMVMPAVARGREEFLSLSHSPWKTDDWFVSPWNFAGEATSGLRPPATLRIHDETLRDGEQQPGIVFTQDDKVRIAEKLAEAGIHRIEAGTPAASPYDEAAVKEIVKRRLGPQIFVLGRCSIDDVKRAVDCGVDGVSLELPASQHLIEHAYRWTTEKATDLAIGATRYAHEQGLYVSFGPVDASRSDMGQLLKLVRRVASEGHMDGLALVDTYGVLSPHGASYYTRMMRECVNKPLEIHFHNNFGLAAANTVMAVLEGGEVVHSTVTGIGEGGGNCPMIEVVMTLRILYGVDAGIRYELLQELSDMVTALAGRLPNHPFVGEESYDVESGTVVTWHRNCRKRYPTDVMPVVPSLVGHREPRYVMGKLSGLASIAIWAGDLDIALSSEQQAEVLRRVKQCANSVKRQLSEDEFRRIADDVKARGEATPGEAAAKQARDARDSQRQ